MIKRKGKGKYFLYVLRRQKKIERNRKRKVHSRLKRKVLDDVTILEHDYKRVIMHLDRNKFELPKMFSASPKREIVDIPSVFSISENTEGVITMLRKIYTIGKNPKTSEIVFNHTKCKVLGLSASTIMDIIVLAVDKYRKEKGIPLDYLGGLPQNKEVRDILLASGLPYHLKANSKLQYDQKNVERFKTVVGRNALEESKADETATQLTLYFDKCLKKQSMELNLEGKRLLSRILGEVISNCEIHGGEGSTWYTQGHYQEKEEGDFGEMQLLFLNLGNTIYEGLKKDSSEENSARLDYVVKKQKRNLSADWDEEMIYTVLALQEGISRLRDMKKAGYEGRGSGTVSMIEMFYDIGESEGGLKPQMTVVSGRVKIRFTDKYKMKLERFDNDFVFGTGEKNIIAFNKSNDIYFPADIENVSKMKENFPGTIISLKFYLDSRYIISRQRKDNR